MVGEGEKGACCLGETGGKPGGLVCVFFLLVCLRNVLVIPLFIIIRFLFFRHSVNTIFSRLLCVHGILSFFLPSCIIQYFRLVHGATPNEKSKDCTPQRSLQFRWERYLLLLYLARFGMRCYFAMHRRGRGRNVSPPKNGRRVLFAHHSVYVPLSYLLRNTHVIFFWDGIFLETRRCKLVVIQHRSSLIARTTMCVYIFMYVEWTCLGGSLVLASSPPMLGENRTCSVPAL